MSDTFRAVETEMMKNIRRYWGLGVDFHKREERLAEFDAEVFGVFAQGMEIGLTLAAERAGRYAEYEREHPDLTELGLGTMGDLEDSLRHSIKQVQEAVKK